MAHDHRDTQDHRQAEYTRAPTAVLLHGFTQNGESWAPLLPFLPGLRVLQPDLPGHGDASGTATGLWATAEALSALPGGPAMWAGYSMGGRTALHVALAFPEAVSALALVSATPGFRTEDERSQRRASDELLARRLETDGVEGFLSYWLSQPLFATLPPERAGREGRLANTAAGLASSLRLSGTGSQEPLWGRLAELGARNLPVLCIAGELDLKYTAIARQMADAIGPSACTLTVAGAGHACHLERPEVVGPAIAAFLASAA